MKVYIADVDHNAIKRERPFMLMIVHGSSKKEAVEAAKRLIADDESVRGVRELQPILDSYIAKVADGHDVRINWKDEGSEGPVWIVDNDDPSCPHLAPGTSVSVPYGSADPAYKTALPWMPRAEAKRLAKYLGVKLEEW